ncbi:hypothetical protein KO516_17525 [Citreicella sp. C3M06]|uniref:DUF5671 domain-containing protein n=1 Tax=Citreicella sp. C3M06 TaxID=2841564 RepID=UPI001C089B1B|nr:DUF5671 domain-containing protein [Citreicella sp. C3M06]MBU2962592.1 hypothetical protein [Citreicella sp. C3M06]
MAEDDRLAAYIGRAMAQGVSKQALRSQLQAEGWTARETDAALAGWSDSTGPAGAIPRPVRSAAARDALFYALLFVAFGMVAGHVIALLFAQIDSHLADPASRSGGSSGGARWSMAALIVFAPTFWLLDRADRRSLDADPARRHGTVRRWLSSLALLIAAITLLSDALWLIYTFLEGMVTSRFLGKSLAVAAMAALVLGYFRQDRGRLPAAAGLLGLVVLVLGATYASIGGPARGRLEARDAARLSDLNALSWDLRTCLRDKPALPETIDPLSCADHPETLTAMASDIRYQRLSDKEFSLCVSVEDPKTTRRDSVTLSGNEACMSLSVD